MTSATGTISVSIPCRYLVSTPETPVRPLLVLTLHGYGHTPEMMLRLTRPLVGDQHIVAALQGPFQHYRDLARKPPEHGYNWGVRAHHEDAIRLHREIVLTVRDRLCREFDIPPARTVLVGFSQPAGFNYRLIGTVPDAAGAVIALCGGVPVDWESDRYQPVSTPILHISRDQDEVFPVATAMQFPERLRRHASNVEFHLLPGPHRFPHKAAPLVREWLARVFQENCM